MADVGNYDTVAAATSDLKNDYPAGTFDAVYRTEAKYRAKLRKDSSFARGADGIVTFPLKLNGMWSVKMTTDNAAFATPKDPGNKQGKLLLETFQTTIQVGLTLKEGGKSNKGTFNAGGIVADRVEQSVAECASYANRVYAGSNRGRLAIVESDGSSNFVASKTAGTTSLGTLLLEIGMDLEAYTAHTSGSVRDSFSNHRITAIDHDTRTVTYVKASDLTTDDRTLVAGDSIYITGTYARTPVSMPDIVDDGTECGTIFSLARSSNPKLKAQMLTNGGALRDVDEQLCMQAIDKPRRYAGKRVTRALSNAGQYWKVQEFIAADRRYPGATSNDPRYKVGIGEGAIDLMGPGGSCPLEVDLDVPPRAIFFLAWDTFFLDERKSPDWIAGEDGVLKLIPTSAGHLAGYIAYYGSVENQGCLMPAATARLGDLKDKLTGD